MANLLHHLPKRDVLMLRWIVVLVVAASAASLTPAHADDHVVTINGDSRGINSAVAVVATTRYGSTATRGSFSETLSLNFAAGSVWRSG
jgi:hypothetical protein